MPTAAARAHALLGFATYSTIASMRACILVIDERGRRPNHTSNVRVALEVFEALFRPRSRTSTDQGRRSRATNSSPIGCDAVTAAAIILLVIISITSHEAAHGLVADRLGDPTARERGRLTLNPLRHIDLFFTILLPLALILSHAGFIIGGAKPVPVNPTRLRRPRRDWALVGAAGPGMNIAIALLLAAILAIGINAGWWTAASSPTQVFSVAIFVNMLLATFNLIPIPPLDGSRIVQYFLAPELLEEYRHLERYGLLIILAAVFFVPGLQTVLLHVIWSGLAIVTGVFGVSTPVSSVLHHLLST